MPLIARPTFAKPQYINAAGDPSFGAMTAVPPFVFRNVTARVFALRANMAALRLFCDQYLNMDIPPTIVHYAPALPYVYLMVLNYGTMSSSSVEAQNLGWVSQHEVAFTVLVQRWREENGELIFKDWATVSPFIYVDDPTSLANGRETYGWNKVLGKIDSEIPLWASDPRAPLRQFDLSVVDFAATYAGEADSRQALLKVDLDPPPTFTEFPPNPQNPWSPIWAVPNAISNAASFLGSAADTALALRLRGYEDNRTLAAVQAMGATLGKKLSSALPGMLQSQRPPNGAWLGDAIAGLPSLFTDAVTLKQFRNPEDPALACYQALVNSKMGVDRVNRLGLLGDINLLRGDSSGGYSIRLHQIDSQPIIQTLGLQVDTWSDGQGATPGALATFKPVLPFWLDVDLYYGKGDVICSRAQGNVMSTAGYWLDEETKRNVPEKKKGSLSLPYYNNALGAATQPVTGPFHFPDVTVQVYPLLSDSAKIEDVLKNYLNDPLQEMISPAGVRQKGWKFKPFGSYVYMMVTVYGAEFGEAWSGTNNIGGFFDREVSFCIPVKWYDEYDKLISVGLVEPFTFSNNGRAVATDREVNGFNTVRATIESPKDIWLEPDGPASRRKLLQMGVEVIPALNLGQKSQQRTLLEIDERDALSPGDAPGWRDIANVWGRDLIDDLKRKSYLASAQEDAVIGGKALALELLAHGAPLNRIVLKQYRDGAQIDRACYQALVHASSTITSVYDVREIGPNVHVRMYRQPGNLIADALGLKVKYQESAGGEVIDVLQPVHPFWMRLGLKEDLATVACYRAKDEPWQIVHPWFEPSAMDAVATKGARKAASGAVPSGGLGASFDPRPPPPRRLAGQQPYFRQQGETRVGAWLAKLRPDGARLRPSGDTLAMFSNKAEVDQWLVNRSNYETMGADLHLDLRNQSQDWLRRAAVNELAWVRVCLGPYPADIVKKYGESAVLKKLLICEIEPGAMTNWAEQYSTQQLIEIGNLVSKIVDPMPSMSDTYPIDVLDIGLNILYNSGLAPLISPNKFVSEFYLALTAVRAAFGEFFETSTKSIRESGLGWAWDEFLDGAITNHIYSVSPTIFSYLGDLQMQAFLMTLPKGAYPLLEDGKQFIASAQFSFETTFDNYDVLDLHKLHNVRDNIGRARQLSDIVELGLLDWSTPSRWKRYKYSDARDLIDSLEDVQLIIDNILSCEWENRSPDARFLNPKGGHKPSECMLVEPQLEPIAIAQGLERWIDPITGQTSDFWMVPIPGASDSIKTDMTPSGHVSGPAPPSTVAAAGPAPASVTGQAAAGSEPKAEPTTGG